jgi:O-antigen chain-terminating methyltransferase
MISPESDVGLLMQRIRMEVAKQKAQLEPPAQQLDAESAPDASAELTPSVLQRLVLPEPDPAIEPTRFKQNPQGTYRLKDLMAYEDREFIQNAYLAILRRPADPGGLENYLGLLRGGMPKIEILGVLLNSAEGRRASSRVIGLPWRYRLLLAARLPLVGPPLAWAHSIFSLAETQREQRRIAGWAFATNEATQQRLQQLLALVNRALSDIEQALGELALFAASRASRDGTAATDAALANLTQGLNAYRAAVQDLRQSLGSSLAAKADRTELTAVEAAVAATLDAALTPLHAAVAGLSSAKAEHAAVEQAVHGTREALESLIASKADHEELAKVQCEVDGRIETALASVDARVAAVLDDKATRAELRGQIVMARSQFRMALDEVRESKAEKSALEAKADHGELVKFHGEVDARIETALAPVRARVVAQESSAREKVDRADLDANLAPLYKSVAALLTSKADRASVETAVHEVRQTLDSVTATKADRTELAAIRTDLGPNLETAIAALREEARLAEEAGRQQAETALRAALRPLEARATDLRRNVIDQERRVGLLLEEARKRLPAPFSTAQLETLAAEDDHHLDALYATFEDRFRGTRSEIKERLSIYLPHIRDAKAGLPAAPVVDLGCGRGEWLELLRDADMQARGIDINRVLLGACRELDLDVIEQDALCHLRSLKPGSVGAVTCFHLIEHLPLKTLIAIFDESLRVLKPGGLAIFETPNPGNLLVGSCNFYFDPTHRNPLPAPLTQSLLEIRGFSRVEVLYLHPYDAANQLRPADQPLQQALNQFLFGPQDYAVFARKL